MRTRWREPCVGRGNWIPSVWGREGVGLCRLGVPSKHAGCVCAWSPWRRAKTQRCAGPTCGSPGQARERRRAVHLEYARRPRGGELLPRRLRAPTPSPRPAAPALGRTSFPGVLSPCSRERRGGYSGLLHLLISGVCGSEGPGPATLQLGRRDCGPGPSRVVALSS